MQISNFTSSLHSLTVIFLSCQRPNTLPLTCELTSDILAVVEDTYLTIIFLSENRRLESMLDTKTMYKRIP